MSGTRRKRGRLGPFVESYRAWLWARDYTPGTTRGMLRVLGQLGRWMSEEGLEPGRVNAAAIEAFRGRGVLPGSVGCRACARCIRW